MRLRNIPEAKGIVEASKYVIKDPKKENRIRETAFEKEQPLYLEIGTGKGRFIIDTALAHPENNYIGIERYESVLFRACLRMEGVPYSTPADQIEQALEGIKPEDLEIPSNLRLIRADARGVADFFNEDEVDGLYLNFSDPWPKARHAGRRLTSRNFLSTYEKILKNGAVLEFKTDNKDLFAFSLEEIGLAPNWDLLYETWDLHRDPVLSEGNILTEYERKFSNLGHAICKLAARFVKPEPETVKQEP